MTVSDQRIREVSDAIVALGYEGIVQFDLSEPEYDYLVKANERFNDEACVALLSILAGTQDYQLAGDAQRFWEALTDTISQRDELASQQQVTETISTFMEETVNARLREQKKERLDRMYGNGFGEWFLDGYPDLKPLRVWEEIAAALETAMDKKTVVFAVKVYDMFNLIVNSEYLELPTDVPIPVDLQVERVAASSGIVEDDSKESILDAWGRVTERVNAELDHPVSMLRIDSIVWQSGQIISENGRQDEVSRVALQEHFEEVGLDTQEALNLASEFTAGLS